MKRLATTLTLALFTTSLLACPPGTQVEDDKPLGDQAEPLPLNAWKGKADKEVWGPFDKAVDEQKYEAASKIVDNMLAEARKAGDTEEETRALIRWVQLRIALHGYEKAVRFLKDQDWPKDLLSRALLNMYYAHTLFAYSRAYSWEIRQRERVDSKGEVDLKKWTMDQIHGAAHRAFQAVWVYRKELGALPVKSLGEFIQGNNYPDGIRGTLRDALSYAWVQLLEYTNGWRPEHLNEKFRLDVATLLDPNRLFKLKSQTKLDDQKTHPLFKIARITADLETWHTVEGRLDAAAEARFTRQRVLHKNFSDADKRKLIREDLERALKLIRDKKWWAMGMHQLSLFENQRGDVWDNRVRSHRVASQCHEAYPSSQGGKRCLHQLRALELPYYSLDGMNSDAPKRRSVGVRYRNLTKLYLRAYPIDLEARVASSKDYNLFPNSDALRKLIDSAKPAFEWQVELEATKDLKDHRHFVTTAIDKPGFYVIVASQKSNFAAGGNQVTAIYQAIGDLVLVARQVADTLDIQVLSGSTGKPIKGATVHLYEYDWRNGHHSVASKVSNAKGELTIKHSQKQHVNYFLLARKGEHVTVDPDYLSLHKPGEQKEKTAALIYTDRSIYRPLQKIHFKAIVYKGTRAKADYKTAPQTAVKITLKDANHQEVASQELTSNEFGTASGTFDIPAGRLMGRWQLVASIGGSQGVRVEEYKRPTFEVKFKDPDSALRLNKKATLKGQAKYYFGLPVTNGKVRWTATRSAVYPWWWWYGGYGGGSHSQTVAAGTTKLGEDGTFVIEFTPEADETLAKTSKHVTYRYAINADVTDEGGETRTAAASYRMGFIAIEARVTKEVNFFRVGAGGELTITRSNLDAAPAPGQGSYRITALAGPDKALLPVDQPLPRPQLAKDAFTTKHDSLRTRWSPNYQYRAVLRSWKDGAEQGSGELTHDAKGKAKLALPKLAAGAYRVHYTSVDAFGAKYETSDDFIVADKKMNLPLPGLMLLERSSVKAGETARVLAVSGLEDQLIYLDVYKDNKLLKRRQLKAGKDAALIELPVTDKDRGGFGVAFAALRDHQLMSFGSNVYVPWDNKQLKVEFSTFRDKLRPGQKETWTVKVTGPSKKKTAVAAAEILAYMYDRSLDIFAPHNPPRPLSLFPWRTGTPWLRESLGYGRTRWVHGSGLYPPGYPHLHGDQLRFYGGYAIGGPGRRGRLLRATTESVDEDADGVADKSDAFASGKASPKKKAKVTSAAAQPIAGEGRDEANTRGPAAAQTKLRTNFSETAFFQPHLKTGKDGSVSFTFTVPDSVTSWNVWIHAVTKDLESGQTKKETRSVKDLMVRPYLPRFLREGDSAALKVVVNNASDKELSGKLTFDIIDPASKKSLLASFGLKSADARKPFTVKAGGGSNLSFPIKTPSKLGLVAFKVTASSGTFSDGELRPLPVLPGRMHLFQSRFVSLNDKERREVTFEDLKKNDDPTLINDQMVVTVDGQLFYSVLSALPYLINYPYECTESTLNRFLATGILGSIYKEFPAVAKMAESLSKRKTRLETWDSADPNRKMALEETPWVRQAKGGTQSPNELANVLDPRVTKATRESSLLKLRKAQTSLGGFPWFPGGPPSPWVTLYILHGFSKGLEFGVEVPKDMVRRAWQYLHKHYINEIVHRCMALDACWETITFINYVLSNFPDETWYAGTFSKAERKTMLDFSFRHWKRHSPYLKGYLALTLHRAQRSKDARLVWESVMDSAKEKKDQGTFWAPEDRSWLWYNDTIESHAFALRTVMEVTPEDNKRDGLVLWLLLNKKLNHWKSTKATAEVIYSLTHYLKKTAALGVREEIKVIAGDVRKSFVFEPDSYTGKKNQIVIPGERVDPTKTSTIVVEKDTKGLAFASATWHFSTERPPKQARGDFMHVNRTYFKRERVGNDAVLKPLAEGATLVPGDEVEVQLSIRTKHAMEYVHLRDPRAAGLEPVSNVSRHKWDLGIYWYEEIRDSGTNFFFEKLPVGEYTFKYRLRVAIAGSYRVAPATIQPMYAPEFTAYSAGATVKIAEAKPPAP